MQIIADLHLHSKFSRAVSRDMAIPFIAGWAAKKGIGLVATGDWTHPMWLKEIQKELEEDGSGILKLKAPVYTQVVNKNFDPSSVAGISAPSISSLRASESGQNFVSSLQSQFPKFLLSTELSCIFSQGGKTRRVHTLIWVPTIAAAMKINQALTRRGCNLLSDGRPILGLSLVELSELVLTSEPKALIVPAHAWTPWFSVFGQMGGFESLSEAFGKYEKNIYAVETGLSSSPDMNWRIKELDSRAIVSFSDAHSGPKLGREATIFNLTDVSFANITDALMLSGDGKSHSANTISYTIEFYPEEGKYHYTGHRSCNIRLTPEETESKGTTCSVCGKPLTQGVMQRVAQLATRDQKAKIKNENELKYYYDEEETRPPFVMAVPLQEIISEAIGSPVASPKVAVHLDQLVKKFGSEFSVLLAAPIEDIAALTTVQIADGVRKVRIGDIVIDPGYDGVFGVVKIWKDEKEKALVDKSKEQLGLF